MRRHYKLLVPESIHKRIDAIQDKMKRGDMSIISKKAGIHASDISKALDAPQSLSLIRLVEIIEKIERYYEN